MKIASFLFTVLLTMFLTSDTTKSIHFLKECNIIFQTHQKIDQVIQNGCHLPYMVTGGQIRLFRIYLSNSFEYFDETWHAISLCTCRQLGTSKFSFRSSF